MSVVVLCLCLFLVCSGIVLHCVVFLLFAFLCVLRVWLCGCIFVCVPFFVCVLVVVLCVRCVVFFLWFVVCCVVLCCVVLCCVVAVVVVVVGVCSCVSVVSFCVVVC